jgi:hypothetical protein|nr:cysteine-rich KTR domain-containing protein [uncultured Acetatifactor sp.]
MKTEWIICPICGRKTHNKIREDIVLINAKDLQITVIQKQEH